MSSWPKTLVIIPTYNEAENIIGLIKELLKFDRLEILVVDDNSPDGTAEKVKQQQKKYPSRIYLISGSKKGLGKAYLRGFKYALEKPKCDIIVMMDGDFSHEPRAIPVLIQAINSGADYVVGSRYISGARISQAWPSFRRWESRAANFLAKILTGIPEVQDLTGGFKALKRSSLEKIDLELIKASGYALQVNLLYAFWSQGMAIKEVPINFRKRQYGSSKLRLRDIWEFLHVTYRLNPDSRLRRLIRFGLVGISGTFVNLLVLIALVNIFKLSPLVAGAIAIEVSIVNNFLLNHHYTFRLARQKHLPPDSPKSFLAKAVRYNLVALGGASITYLVFVFSYKVLKIHYVPADLIAVAVATAWNYFMSVRIVWRIVDK